MKDCIAEILKNEIALAMMVFTIIIIASAMVMGTAAKDVFIQVITAIGALVTGQSLRSKNERATDKPPTTEKKEG